MIAVPSTGCFSTHHQRLEPGTSLDEASGITTRSGEEIRFAVDGATIMNDTLFARGKSGALKVPTDSVARVASRKFSAWRTAAVVVGVAAAAFTVMALTYIRSFAVPD
jgi:hypothetical protein